MTNLLTIKMKTNCLKTAKMCVIKTKDGTAFGASKENVRGRLWHAHDNTGAIDSFELTNPRERDKKIDGTYHPRLLEL